MEQTRLRVHLEVRGDRLLVRPEGRLNEATRAIFQQALGAAMNVERRVRVDLTRVTYVDHHGACALLDMANRHPYQEMELEGDTSVVTQVLNLIRADSPCSLEVSESPRRSDPKATLVQDLRVPVPVAA